MKNSAYTDISFRVNLLLYVANRLGGAVDYHKLFKILYFADQIHLVNYGRLISNETYFAMKYGPVPTLYYDDVKQLEYPSLGNATDTVLQAYFDMDEHNNLITNQQANLDYFSISEIESLDEAIKRIGDLDFKQRTAISHDMAWEKAWRMAKTLGKKSYQMDISEIARAGGATDEQIEYINLNNENSKYEIHYSECQ